MSANKTRLWRPARFLAVAIAIAASGCSHWARPQEPMPQTLKIVRERAQPVRVYLKDGARLEYYAAIVRNDSLIDVSSRGCYGCGVPVANIERIEVRRLSALKTAGAIAGGYAGLIAVTLVLFVAMLAGS